MEVYQLPSEEEARWRDAAREAWPKLYDVCGGQEWVEKFEAAVLEARDRLTNNPCK
jgi:hypothetical protein